MCTLRGERHRPRAADSVEPRSGVGTPLRPCRVSPEAQRCSNDVADAFEERTQRDRAARAELRCRRSCGLKRRCVVTLSVHVASGTPNAQVALTSSSSVPSSAFGVRRSAQKVDSRSAARSAPTFSTMRSAAQALARAAAPAAGQASRPAAVKAARASRSIATTSVRQSESLFTHRGPWALAGCALLSLQIRRTTTRP